jgi:hypothetical protein
MMLSGEACLVEADPAHRDHGGKVREQDVDCVTGLFGRMKES